MGDGLEQMQDGVYGECGECGERIALSRDPLVMLRMILKHGHGRFGWDDDPPLRKIAESMLAKIDSGMDPRTAAGQALGFEPDSEEASNG